ncbi:mitogen-activated protein kinase 16-like [Brassica napus]|uniref:mitogen-activated protein kinase 16-like n=1 Tax=Brassica napus TaxID=3708 RepID=UPI0006AA5E2E|nr:mitogen-activated protein kinase 16-like [Brassica napus]
MLSFEPKDMPTSEEALADPYFKNLAKVERELSCQPVTKLEFEFERRRIRKEDVRELGVSRVSPKMLKEYLDGSEPPNFMYPSGNSRNSLLTSRNISRMVLAQHASLGLVFCTLVTTMRRHNRVQWKSLMDSPSVASEIHSDCVVLTGEFLLASLKLFKVLQ